MSVHLVSDKKRSFIQHLFYNTDQFEITVGAIGFLCHIQWFASCRIITKHSAADAYELEAEQLKDDGYRHMIASMLRGADFGIHSRTGITLE